MRSPSSPYRAALERFSSGSPAGVSDDRRRLALADAERFLAERGEAARRAAADDLLKGERIEALTKALAPPIR